MGKEKLIDGEPCDHRGCLNHVTHPCEGCGRIVGHALSDDTKSGLAGECYEACLNYQDKDLEGM